MDQQLISALVNRMEELEALFCDDAKGLFSQGDGLYVKKGTVLKSGELISILPHPRFRPTLAHQHNYIEIMYVWQGSITHIINGAKVVMEAGDILLMNQYISHAILPTGAEDLGVNLLVLPEFFETAIGMLGKNNFLADFVVDLLRRKSRSGQYLHFKLAGNRQTANLLENLIFSLVHKPKENTHINQTLMGLLFLYLLENADSLSHEAPNNYKDILSNSIQMYIGQHYKSAVLTELAEKLRFSLPYLSRFIRQMTGHTFKELLQRRRLEVAKTMLAETTLSVGDIMTAVGYENHSYFFRLFKKECNLSPKEYRLLQIKNPAPERRGRNKR